MATGNWLRKRKNDLIFVAVAGLVKILRVLPENVATGLMAFLGKVAFIIAKKEREKTIRHLTSVYGDRFSREDITVMGRAVFANLGRNGCAAIRIPSYLRSGLRHWVKIEGREYLDAALAPGNGVLAITGHIGSWELMAAFFANSGYRLAVVGKPLYDPRLDKLLVQGRESAGLINFSRNGAARQMLRWLKEGGMLGVLIDQDTRVESDFVDFMGRPAFTPIAPMLLAQRVGARVVPMAVHRQNDGTHLIKCRPELILAPDDGSVETRRHNLQICSKAVESFIHEEPTQWVWMHERWKTRPEEKRIDV